MSVPSWYGLIVLALAAWRTFRIICCDTIFDGPRARLCARLGDKFTEWITCPFCAGFWISVAWWGAWQLWPHGTLVVAAVSAIAGLLALVEINGTHD